MHYVGSLVFIDYKDNFDNNSSNNEQSEEGRCTFGC